MSSPGDSSPNIARDLRAVFGRLYRRFKELSDNQGLTPSQASLLSRLGKEGDASVSALAAAERIRPQAVVPTLAALQERGLIERRPDPSDGRRQLISLSPTGRTMFQGAQLEGDEWLGTAIRDRLTPAERTTLAEALKLLERLTTD
ncbi:MarR family winged helix-turn-helix transcriptional regulator [Glycomyces artemisiae]|uniref:DNA-binding MarR family transcriptional regulator n=1 Tax=Glycomyces artemisiae TaxID=1076443 RepID=A0A2T0UVU9_9ACTN|nr:MarR family transcriptional regulator [Glycomyces artemisiae]PRY62034.1 DNA-binding MarR family transcriptional regulator [Glycomyces artemisiae]